MEKSAEDLKSAVSPSVGSGQSLGGGSSAYFDFEVFYFSLKSSVINHCTIYEL